MILSQLVRIYPLMLFVLHLPAEYFTAGVDDYCVALDFSRYPLSQAHHEVLVHEKSDAVGNVVPGFALVAAIAVINDWE